MAQASRDENRVPTLLGVSSVDLETPTTAAVNPVTHAVITEGGSGGGDASAANQTSGAQKTQIVDSGGEGATVTGGKLDVNASVDTTGLALDATLTNKSQFTKITDGTDTAEINTRGDNKVALEVNDRDLCTRIDEASSTVTYLGAAAAGTASSAASWQIKKIDSSSNPTVITYADGNANFDNIYDNRTSLSYS